MTEPDQKEQKPLAFSYPYESTLAQTVRQNRVAGRRVDEWIEPDIDVKSLIEHVDAPIIELAGPTDTGYYYLDGVRLPSQPLISNLAPGTLLYGKPETRDKQLDQLLDVRQLALPDNSVGMIIAAYLPFIDEEDFDFSNFNSAAEAEHSRRLEAATAAVRYVAKSGELNIALIKQSL